MIWIILLGGMVQGAFAQNLEIKGMVRDARNKEILEFANVVLQTMDSSFVAGTTTVASSAATNPYRFPKPSSGDPMGRPLFYRHGSSGQRR